MKPLAMIMGGIALVVVAIIFGTSLSDPAIYVNPQTGISNASSLKYVLSGEISMAFSVFAGYVVYMIFDTYLEQRETSEEKIRRIIREELKKA